MDEVTCLDGLARALSDAGWGCVTRYRERPALLRVHGGPGWGDSVLVSQGWFWSSVGVPLAPCEDVEVAVERVGRLLRAYGGRSLDVRV